MNERIKELAEQANANELSYAYYRGEKRPENAVTLHSVDLEKFAELIIRECASELTKLGFSYKNSDHDADYMQGMLDSADIIKEHFGVEK